MVVLYKGFMEKTPRRRLRREGCATMVQCEGSMEKVIEGSKRRGGRVRRQLGFCEKNSGRVKRAPLALMIMALFRRKFTSDPLWGWILHATPMA